jgi:hypothetical protein
MLMTAEECRFKAAECEKRVGSAGHFEMRVQYRELALAWRSLAEQLEQLAARGEQAIMDVPPQAGRRSAQRRRAQGCPLWLMVTKLSIAVAIAIGMCIGSGVARPDLRMLGI